MIPRWIGIGPDVVSGESHGFSDASTIAYAAVVYLRIVYQSNPVMISLSRAKPRSFR